MRDLTHFETAAISGGDLHAVVTIPADQLSDEDKMIVLGIGAGVFLGGAGAIFGGAIEGLGGALVLGTVGAVGGAIGVPIAVKCAVEGLRFTFRTLRIT